MFIEHLVWAMLVLVPKDRAKIKKRQNSAFIDLLSNGKLTASTYT